MSNPQQQPSLEQLTNKMVHDLEATRDALTHLSLMLHDLRFEMDHTQRQTAADQAADCIARSQARQA